MTDSSPERPARPSDTAPANMPSRPYRALARAYRPTRLSELIGQDVVVRSLTNAMRTGRVAHAFLLTGIRGVGKTTTARIIARALNCIGQDGTGGPTPEPCGVCEHCVAIGEDRHIDVFEMDAATRTGIDDIREIVESVRYAPTSARQKVYVIDEVHMLSEKAFNGLLKTLEEPPPHARFVFATTEVRKIPVTILSRCQRFDLRRVDAERLAKHLENIAAKERIEVEAAAIALIARAAEGSVRDGLSLLDQAIALAGSEGLGSIGADQVRDMIGLADRSRLLELFERTMRGDVPGALDGLAGLHELGSEPEIVVHDLLEICHWLTRLKVAPEVTSTFGVDPGDASRGRTLAEGLRLPVLARAWQMLLKGLDELRLAPEPMRAAEMLLVRIAYAADLPPPAEVMKQLEEVAGGGSGPAGPTPGPARSDAGAPQAGPALAERPQTARAEPPDTGPAGAAHPIAASPASFEETVQLFRHNDQPMLYSWLHDRVSLVHFEPGRIELNVNGHAPRDLPKRVAACLEQWTERHWHVSVCDHAGTPSLGEQAAARKQARLAELAADPRVKPVLDSFPGARIVDVRVPDER